MVSDIMYSQTLGAASAKRAKGAACWRESEQANQMREQCGAYVGDLVAWIYADRRESRSRKIPCLVKIVQDPYKRSNAATLPCYGFFLAFYYPRHCRTASQSAVPSSYRRSSRRAAKMDAPPGLERLPAEIFLNITANLYTHDLAQLSYCSKALAALVVPLLWTDIEFHDQDYHESPLELNDPPPFRRPSSRLHHNPMRKRGRRSDLVFFFMLVELHGNDLERLKVLASRVKHICTDIMPMCPPVKIAVGPSRSLDVNTIQVWHLLPFFSNLESLELHGDHPSKAKWEQTVDDITEPPPSRLRFAKLFRYIPRAVAAWVLRAGSTLERLELGMLDRPISTCLANDPEFKPLPEENKLAEDDPDGPEWGSLYGEFVIPRPLGDFLPSSGRVRNPSELSLPKLKHLYLCQPTYSQGRSSNAGAGDYYTWSSRAEESCLEDWRAILRATSATVETLVLEQRPAGEWIELDGIESRDWMIDCIDTHAGDGLIDMVLTIMAKTGLKKLRHVYLYGMSCYEDELESNTEYKTSAGSLLRALQAVGVHGEARRGMWCGFDNDNGKTQFGTYYDVQDDEDEYWLDPNERSAEEIQDWLEQGQERMWDKIIARV